MQVLAEEHALPTANVVRRAAVWLSPIHFIRTAARSAGIATAGIATATRCQPHCCSAAWPGSEAAFAQSCWATTLALVLLLAMLLVLLLLLVLVMALVHRPAFAPCSTAAAQSTTANMPA